MKFSRKQIEQSRTAYNDIQNKYPALQLRCNRFLKHLPRKKTKEYLQHGFMRRLGTAKRCIENIYRIWPPERDKLLSKEEREDVTINLQAFIFNIFGILENLTIIFDSVKNLMDSNSVKEFRDYLASDKHKIWEKYLKNFRDALGHRIPLYVPPFALNREEAKRYLELDKQMQEALQKYKFDKYEKLSQEQGVLGTNCPLMTHSFSENADKVAFHGQVLSDFNTVIEVAEKLFNGFSN